MTLLADGQLTFALGVAFGLAALRFLQVGRHGPALAAAAACALSSPVAGAFLAGVVLAGSLQPGRRASVPAIWVACLPLGLIVASNLAFPESGQFPFALSAYLAIPLWCGGALFVTRGLREEERQLHGVLVAYVLAATVLWLVPNPMGGNAARLGALFGGPVLAAVVLARRPALAGLSVLVLAGTMAGGLYWQLTASVNQIARSVGDPSHDPVLLEPAAHWLRLHGGRGVRVEVPPTANHWESAYMAPDLELARGWLRQLDTTRDDLFYADDAPLTGRSYSAWLHDNAIRYVALPDVGLDYSSAGERRLIVRGPPLSRAPLELRALAHLRGAEPRASGAVARQWRSPHSLDWPPGLGAERHPSRRVPRQGQLHAVLVDCPRQRVPPAARRLDPGPGQPHGHLPGGRRLLAGAGVERCHPRPQDLLTSAAHRFAFADGSKTGDIDMDPFRAARRWTQPVRAPTGPARAAPPEGSGCARGTRRRGRRRGCGDRRQVHRHHVT